MTGVTMIDIARFIRRFALDIPQRTETQNMRIYLSVLPALTVAAALGFSATPIGAQDSAAEADAPSTVCLARQVSGGRDEGKSVVISVSADKADEFGRRGFAPTDCSASQIDKSSRQQDFCEIMRMREKGIELYFLQNFGFTPEEHCKTINASSVR